MDGESNVRKVTVDALVHHFADALEIIRLSRIRIVLGDDPIGRKLYTMFTAPHRRIPWLREKEWGVALQPIPASFDEFIRGSRKQALRTNARRCEQFGFTGTAIAPLAHLDAILGIYQSSEIRQGPVNVDLPQLIRFCTQPNTMFFGLFNEEGALRAYTGIEITGELAYFHTFIGHSDDLENGIMYGLLAASMRHLIALPTRGGAKYALYDSYYGHGPGLRYFMRRCGFEPFNVTWRCPAQRNASQANSRRAKV